MSTLQNSARPLRGIRPVFLFNCDLRPTAADGAAECRRIKLQEGLPAGWRWLVENCNRLAMIFSPGGNDSLLAGMPASRHPVKYLPG